MASITESKSESQFLLQQIQNLIYNKKFILAREMYNNIISGPNSEYEQNIIQNLGLLNKIEDGLKTTQKKSQFLGQNEIHQNAFQEFSNSSADSIKIILKNLGYKKISVDLNEIKNLNINIIFKEFLLNNGNFLFYKIHTNQDSMFNSGQILTFLSLNSVEINFPSIQWKKVLHLLLPNLKIDYSKYIKFLKINNIKTEIQLSEIEFDENSELIELKEKIISINSINEVYLTAKSNYINNEIKKKIKPKLITTYSYILITIFCVFFISGVINLIFYTIPLWLKAIDYILAFLGLSSLLWKYILKEEIIINSKIWDIKNPNDLFSKLIIENLYIDEEKIQFQENIENFRIIFLKKKEICEFEHHFQNKKLSSKQKNLSEQKKLDLINDFFNS